MSYLDNTGLAYFWQKIKTILYSANNPPPYPVTSVNNQIGAVSVPTVAIQDNAPTDNSVKLWIDTDDPGTTHIIPEIDDTQESASDTWSSNKISSEISATTSFTPLSLTWNKYHCSGTVGGDIPVIALSGDGKTLMFYGGRPQISSFSRSGDNPGFTFDTDLRPTDEIKAYVGFRIDNTTVKPEIIWLIIGTDGVGYLKTSETHSNASGTPLKFYVFACQIPIA